LRVWEVLVVFQHALAEEMVTDGAVLSMYTAFEDMALETPPAITYTL
jgi:hypothetical protein